MSRHTQSILYTCQGYAPDDNECGHEFRVSVSPVIPARLSGPPEDCYPEEGGECDPDACPKCGKDIDQDKAIESAADDYAQGKADAAEARAEDRRLGL